jgi:glycosyltransferase involved in cell wall biosynthesis
VVRNIRLYGWNATAKKVAFRFKLLFAAPYRKSQWIRGKQSGEIVSSPSRVFGRPVILIVGALDLPQCKKYRVSQKVDCFTSMGWECHVAHYNDAHRALSYLQISTAVIFYRVPNCAQFDDYMEEAHRLCVKTFYDIDDPIFNAHVYGENKNLDHISPGERSHLLASAPDYLDAMRRVDACILSTTYLQALAAADLGTQTYLWRNLVDSATLSIVESVSLENGADDTGKIIIGYASGSRAHDEDFRIVSAALQCIFQSYPDVELHIIGYATIPAELSPFRHRINVRPFSGYLKYLESLSRVDINIVPLVNDRFNACKSAIRYLEASLCAVPTIASSVGQFTEVIIDGRDGKLADSSESWIAALRSCIETRALRLALGEAALKNVMERHTFNAVDAVDHILLKQFALSDE